MLKQENLNNTSNPSKEKIKFSGIKDAPKKFHTSHKESKIIITKAPIRSTSFILMHSTKEINPRTFKSVQINVPKNLTHTAYVSQKATILSNTKAKHTLQQQILPLQSSFSTVLFPLQVPLSSVSTSRIYTSLHRPTT